MEKEGKNGLGLYWDNWAILGSRRNEVGMAKEGKNWLGLYWDKKVRFVRKKNYIINKKLHKMQFFFSFFADSCPSTHLGMIWAWIGKRSQIFKVPSTAQFVPVERSLDWAWIAERSQI